MIILKGLLICLYLIIIPELLGLLLLKFMKKYENNIIFAFVLGYLSEFAICQLITVPMIFFKASLETLLYIFQLVIIFICIISIILNIKRIKEIFKSSYDIIKKSSKFLIIVLIICIGVQIYGLVGYMHEDADDAFYVGTITTTLETNSLFRDAGQDGRGYGNDIPLRYVLGPFPMYHAMMSKILSIHPAIFTHTIIPIIFISLSYMVYGLIASKFFKEKIEDTLLFLIFLSVLSIWGNYSTRSTFSLLLFRIWQGKAVLANILIPAMWLVYLIVKECDYKFVNYLLITITVIAGTFTTTLGIALMPLSLMVLTIVDELTKINFKDLKNINYKKHLKQCAKSFCCCIPSLVYLVVYFIK